MSINPPVIIDNGIMCESAGSGNGAITLYVFESDKINEETILSYSKDYSTMDWHFFNCMSGSEMDAIEISYDEYIQIKESYGTQTLEFHSVDTPIKDFIKKSS
jgi:hypothetical protein